jgi:hypothetical protein
MLWRQMGLHIPRKQDVVSSWQGRRYLQWWMTISFISAGSARGVLGEEPIVALWPDVGRQPCRYLIFPSCCLFSVMENGITRKWTRNIYIYIYIYIYMFEPTPHSYPLANEGWMADSSVCSAMSGCWLESLWTILSESRTNFPDTPWEFYCVQSSCKLQIMYCVAYVISMSIYYALIELL